MKKRTKILTTGLLSLSMVSPSVALAENVDITESKSNENININLERKSVLLGDKSKVSITFKEKPQADSITLNQICYDMPLNTTLNYNQDTNAYEGEINFNKDPEYLNVWEIESIVINNHENPQTLTSKDLQELGLDLNEYDVTQEYIITNARSMDTYMQKASAPVKKLVGDTRFETAIAISKEGWKNGSDKVIIVNGDAIADGITATPLATTVDAPILLTNKDSMPQTVKEELKRLNPSEVIIIGSTGVISNKAINDIKTVINPTINRIGGIDRHETSLKIAKEIDKYHDVEKVYIANGYKGEVDALTIAAKAGQDKQPIILSEKTSIPTSTYNWLKNENLETGYFIGGEDVIATNVIHQIADITPKHETDPENSVYKNRISGLDRHETNANVMKKFYKETELDAVLVAKSDVLVDALAAGPLAAKLNSPIIITPTTYVSAYHENNLKEKTANTIYQVGGGIKDKVINDIAYKLSKHNSGGKTVVIDPGHGGSDSGAVNPVDRTIMEKNYTLDTALATTEYLRSQDINVVMTRDKDVTLANGTRVDSVNKVNADLVASIHYNSAGTQGYGIEVYHKFKDKNGGTSKTMATNIINSVLEKFNLRNRGTKTRTLNDGVTDYYFMIREINSPSVIVECAFIDNEGDIQMVDTLQERRELGQQIGKGIEKTLK